MASVLLTGATGFIGAHLLAKLKDRRHTVISVGHGDGDVATPATWTAFPAAEIVIHLAGKTFVPESWADPQGFTQTNLNGTIGALEYCRRHQSRLVFISSYLYGVPRSLPIAEDAAVHPNNPYAMSKKLAEDACRFYADFHGVPVTILRPFNVYGPGQNKRFLIPSIVDQVIAGQPLKILDLEPRRDYLYVDDLTEAFARAIDQPQGFVIMNVASGTSHSVAEVIATVQRLAGTDLPVISEGHRRAQEVMDTRADITRAREVLGWTPRWSLESGLAALIEYGRAAAR